MPDIGHEVTKRYSDFSALDATLRSYGVELPLPPKKVFGKMDSEFIEQRQEGLQVKLSLDSLASCFHLYYLLCISRFHIFKNTCC